MARVRFIILAALVLALILALAGCTANGAPKTVKTPSAPKPVAAAAPAPPPAEPLSIPQTQVKLPKAQPLNPGALETAAAPPPVETPAPAPRSTPARTKVV